MQGTVQRERPTGVTILAVLAIIGGLFGLLAGVGLLFLGGLGATVDGGLGALVMIIGGGILVVAVLELAFGFGAWTLKPWAWTLGVASQVLSLILAIASIVFLGSSITSQIVGIIISVAILYYLFTPPIKAAFGRA